MRVTLIIFSLSCGGAERVIAIMANYWAEKGWRITLLTFDDGRDPPFYDLHPAIMRRPLGIAGHSATPIQGVVNNLKRLRVLRRAIRESAPQVVLSFMHTTNVRILLATLGLRLPVIVCEQISLTHSQIGKVWKILRRWTYSRATCLVVLTQGNLAYFSEAVQRRAHVIPNPARLTFGSSIADPNHMAKTVVAMGRLEKQKGFDLLQKAFADISPKHPDWLLVIWGEGALRAELEALRDELGLQGRVSFPGLTREPDEKMRRAELFVLSSRYEGFPLVLCEAMASGLPVVSFDCPTGPREIIRDGIDGILVPPGDVRALASAMDRLMYDDSERKRLAVRAAEVVERFGVEKVMGMWEAVLHDAINRPGTSLYRG